MIKLLAFVFIIGCSSSRMALPPEASVMTKNHSSENEARNSVKNRWNYLFLLFEQSHDPYYGTPRWPVECLKKNTLGQLQETNGNVFFHSRFLLNERKEAGFCEGQDTDVIYLHCKNELVSYEIHCPPGRCEKFFKENVCPLNR